LQVAAEEHAGAEREAHVVGEVDIVAQRRAEEELGRVGDADHRLAVDLA
jgi:hypothetical protein